MKKAERLNQELIFLQDRKKFQLRNLMEEFSISKRTALRDIEELESMGLALYSEPGRSGGYQLLKQSLPIPIYFSIEEIQVIFFALKALNVVSSTPFSNSFQRIQQKLYQTMNLEVQESVEKILNVVRYYNVAPVHHLKNLDLLLDAILHQQLLIVTNKKLHEETITFQPYEMFYRNGIWFISGYNHTTKRLHIYRCEYFEKVIVEVDNQAILPLEELKRAQEQFEDKEHSTKFRFQLTPLGKEMFLKNSYPNMELEIINGTSYIVGAYNEDEFDYMIQYALGFGEHIFIEKPRVLKDAYLDKVRGIISRY